MDGKATRARKPKKSQKAGLPDGVTASSLIMEAIKAQTKDFTIVDIRGYLDSRHQAASARITGNRISKELYTLRLLRKPPVIILVKQGAKGEASTYRRTNDL